MLLLPLRVVADGDVGFKNPTCGRLPLRVVADGDVADLVAETGGRLKTRI